MRGRNEENDRGKGDSGWNDRKRTERDTMREGWASDGMEKAGEGDELSVAKTNRTGVWKTVERARY